MVLAADPSVQAAQITVFGTVIVGVLAMLGTLAGTLIAPFAIKRVELRDAARAARADALRAIIPNLVRLAAIANKPGANTEEQAALLEEQTRFAVWLTADEWPLGVISEHGLLLPEGDPKRFAAAALILPKWMRGELTPEEAKASFERATGMTIVRDSTA